MREKREITDDMLQEARLGGVSCRACALAETTTLDTRAGRRAYGTSVEGVQTWRGKAVVEDPAFWAVWQRNIRMVYEGVVYVGEEVRHVTAEVFVFSTRRAQRRGGRGGHVTHAEFVGAGGLPPAA